MLLILYSSLMNRSNGECECLKMKYRIREYRATNYYVI